MTDNGWRETAALESERVHSMRLADLSAAVNVTTPTCLTIHLDPGKVRRSGATSLPLRVVLSLGAGQLPQREGKK
jgi:hypothetical protein